MVEASIASENVAEMLVSIATSEASASGWTASTVGAVASAGPEVTEKFSKLRVTGVLPLRWVSKRPAKVAFSAPALDIWVPSKKLAGTVRVPSLVSAPEPTW